MPVLRKGKAERLKSKDLKSKRKYNTATLRLLPLIILISGLAFNTQSQNVEAFSKLDTTAILIGDQIGLEVGIRVPEGFRVQWPLLVDTITKHIEIIDKKPIDTSSSNGNLTLIQKLTVTSFDSGYFEIPDMEITFHPEGDTNRFIANTNTLYLSVTTPVVDTSQAFKIIKGPVKEPYTLGEILLWVLYFVIGVLVILGIIFLIKYDRKKKYQPLFKKTKPLLPPDILAIQKLEELRLAKIWQQGKLKEYHTQLTDIAREYFEGRYHFEAMEMTSHDILEELKNHNINNEAMGKIANVLQLADLVKFAKANPAPLENDLSLSHCIDFVKETKPAPVVQNDGEKDSSEQTKIKAS